jgi:hypothetical protein
MYRLLLAHRDELLADRPLLYDGARHLAPTLRCGGKSPSRCVAGCSIATASGSLWAEVPYRPFCTR